MNGFLHLLKITLVIIFLFSIALVSPSFVQAQNEIEEDLFVEYDIVDKGETNFRYEIELSLPQEESTAISTYYIEFPFEDMIFETIKSDEKHLRANLKKQANHTKLSIDLEDRILTAQDPITIILEGNIQEKLIDETTFTKILNISSGIADIEPSETVLKYPKEFGRPTSSAIDWDIKEFKEKYRLQTNEPSKIINIIWGEYVVYNFQINKTLTNTSKEPITSFDVSLPKAHYNQKVLISSINPTPHFAYKDEEDNLFISYNLKPNDEIGVQIRGQIINTQDFEKTKLSAFKRPILTEQEGYWELTDEYEKNRFEVYLRREGIEQKHIEDMKPEERKAFYKLAYEYVKDRLNMQETKQISMESEIRAGADNALDNRNNSPPENYVDLLSAIYRSYGVPTKMIEGYVIQQDEFFHSWLQFWDEEDGWKMADPALADYTGQNFYGKNFEHHVIFLQRGQNYINPRVTFFTKDNINLSFSESKNEENISIEEKVDISPIKKTTDQITGEMNIKNTGNTIISLKNIVQNENVDLGVRNPLQVVVPRQSVNIPFVYNKNQSQDDKIVNKYTSINNTSITSTIELESQEAKFWWWDTLITIITLLIIWIIIYIIYLISKITHVWIKNYYQ